MPTDPFGGVGGDGQSSRIANSSLSTVADSYLRYYAQGHSHTARAKQLDLQHFLKFLARMRGYSNQSKLKVSDWDHSSVQRFVDDSLRHGEAPATVARRLATIKHMGRTLAEKVAGFVNPARDVKAPKLQIEKPKSILAEEIEQVRERAESRISEKDSFIRKRNMVLFSLLIDTGLRADEVRMLKLSQIDEKMEWIKNVQTKGHKFRNVYITSEMRPLLKRYLEWREKELKRHIGKLSKSQSRALPLFISGYAADPSKPESFLMGAKTIWRAVSELSAESHLHPHLLRHSFATDLLKHSNDVRLVAQALGHSDVRVTMRYTERRAEEVAAALESSRKNR